MHASFTVVMLASFEEHLVITAQLRLLASRVSCGLVRGVEDRLMTYLLLVFVVVVVMLD